MGRRSGAPSLFHPGRRVFVISGLHEAILHLIDSDGAKVKDLEIEELAESAAAAGLSRSRILLCWRTRKDHSEPIVRLLKVISRS